MPIRAAAVGQEIGPYAFEITTRSALAYAAGLGETADVYFDDARPEGIIAPPMMVIPLEWPASRDLRETPAFGATDEERQRVVHAEQDTQIHQPLRPGMRVKSTGRLVAVKRVKPGALTISRLSLETTDGDPIATSYSTAIYRGVDIDGDDCIEDQPPAWPEQQPSGAWAEKPVSIARQLPHIYTECADIWSPIHTERAVALGAGLPDIILHGTCTLALAIKELVIERSGGDPLLLKRFACRFTGMVIPGTDIQVRHAATPRGSVFEVLNADGDLAISRGQALFNDG
jgi:acyl dehydratase